MNLGDVAEYLGQRTMQIALYDKFKRRFSTFSRKGWKLHRVLPLGGDPRQRINNQPHSPPRSAFIVTPERRGEPRLLLQLHLQHLRSTTHLAELLVASKPLHLLELALGLALAVPVPLRIMHLCLLVTVQLLLDTLRESRVGALKPSSKLIRLGLEACFLFLFWYICLTTCFARGLSHCLSMLDVWFFGFCCIVRFLYTLSALPYSCAMLLPPHPCAFY